MHRTDWLEGFGHPSASVDFALPNGIYFLLEFLPELQQYSGRSLQDRLAIYFWWEAIGARCYPDFKWALRQQDRASLNAISDEALCTSFTKAIGFWLRYTDSSSLERPSLMRLLLKPPAEDNNQQIKLPYFLHVLRNDRDDLRRDFDLDMPSSRLAYLRWWETHGAVEYARMPWSAKDIVEELSTLEKNSGTMLAQPRMLDVIWRHRSGLRQNYAVHTLGGQLAYLGWWQLHSTEYPTLDWSPRDVFDELRQLEIEEGTAPLALPRLLNLVWKERPDLHAHLSRSTLKGQFAFVNWWQEEGQANYPEIQWSTDELLNELITSRPTDYIDGIWLPYFVQLVWNERDDLINTFNRSEFEGICGIVHWWNQAGRHEYSLLRNLLIEPEVDSDGVVRRFVVQSNLAARSHPFGVNIIGFPQGILGLAEDARMMGHALELASVPRAFVNAPIAGPAKVDTSVTRLLTLEPKYRVSVFCLPPPEMMRLSLEGGRNLIDSATYKVGAWPWELPQWPTAFARVHQFVDEIWAQSRFVQTAFRKLGDTPVHHMPMAVDIPAPTQRVRGRFGLPEDDFLFYLMFDGNSWLTRKNPLAGVQAFQKAFDASISGVGLVIKGMNIREDDAIWKRIRDMASRDWRIRIVSEKLTRQDLINFMASLDSYVSLHRSEGFGRVIAEAMLLAQPVVVTNFSGNVDYCDTETAFLVDGELVPLKAGDYLFHEGQYWCDPDVAQAAQQIRRVFEDAAARNRIAAAGQQRLQQDYSIAAVSRRYAERIESIDAEIRNR
ncbi:glycosyltransferase family 4 protein [Paraburkholderia sp. SIMBA_053]|uniref:glycosyltransferase family 4 protein n=1 Tax=Paraburkholderia sp. SIMBA_053 TaxID=3085794 RepID=UPI00397D9E7F